MILSLWSPLSFNWRPCGLSPLHGSWANQLRLGALEKLVLLRCSARFFEFYLDGWRKRIEKASSIAGYQQGSEVERWTLLVFLTVIGTTDFYFLPLPHNKSLGLLQECSSCGP